MVEADASQFDTALINMAVNARDAMDGEGTLTVWVGSVPKMPPIRGHGPGRFAAVSLTDTGCGSRGTTSGGSSNRSLRRRRSARYWPRALTSVRFAKQSGGDFDVASEIGHGSTFTIYLPQVEPEVFAHYSMTGIGRTGPADDGRGRRVLMVEDTIEVGRFSTQLLQDLGYETIWASNADEALTVLGGAPVDVVLSDVVMPGMSGV